MRRLSAQALVAVSAISVLGSRGGRMGTAGELSVGEGARPPLPRMEPPLPRMNTQAPLAEDEDMFQEILGLLRDTPRDEQDAAFAQPGKRERVVGAWSLRAHMALGVLREEAIRALILKFLPDKRHWRGSTGLRKAQQLMVEEAMSMIPTKEAAGMLSLNHSAMVGEMCHHLSIRIQRFPWLEAIQSREIPVPKLKGLLVKAGFPPLKATDRKQVVAKILREAMSDAQEVADERAALKRLLDRLMKAQGRKPRSPSDIGYMDECPADVQSAFARARPDEPPASRGKERRPKRSAAARAAASIARYPQVADEPPQKRPRAVASKEAVRDLVAERLGDLLVKLGPEAVHALFAKFVPDSFCDLQQAPRDFSCMVRKITAEVVPMVPESQAQLMLKNQIAIAEVVGEICHRLSARLKQMPWVDALEKMSGGELRSVYEEAGLPPPKTYYKKSLRVKLLMEATKKAHEDAPAEQGAQFTGRRRRSSAEVRVEQHRQRRVLNALDKLLKPGEADALRARQVGFMSECPDLIQDTFSFVPPKP